MLRFPTLDVLKIALTSELVPAEVASAPVDAIVRAQDVLIAPTAALTIPVLQQLLPLGVTSTALDPVEDQGHRIRAPNWLAVFPLARSKTPPPIGTKTAILFELSDSQQLTEVVSEMLRLGNDRQSFRQLESSGRTRTLLRVLNPPYYTLLRAMDRLPAADTRSNFHLVAYYEQSPRVWVQLGYEHPLAARIHPAPGQWLLIRSPREWELLNEAAFQDVYHILDLHLPHSISEWEERTITDRIRVPLRLTSAANSDPAELWVLVDNAIRQVEQLVTSSDNELIARLAFAVIERDGQTWVVLRVRPSKLPPPVLILHGVAFRNYQKLPNLFVPVGRQLHPPLRRQAVAELLARDPHLTVWLHPNESGAFVPYSIPDSAFLPLSQWVDYVLDHEQQALTTWIAAHQFDFSSFISAEEVVTRHKSPKMERPNSPSGASLVVEPIDRIVDVTTDDREEPVLAEVIEPPPEVKNEVAEEIQLNSAQQQLTQLERQFIALELPLDDSQRTSLWREMAQLNGVLERGQELSLCWSHVLWEGPADDGDEPIQWLQQLVGDRQIRLPLEAEIKRLLDRESVARLEIIRFAVQLIAAAQGGQTLAGELASLATRALTRHENAIPIRIAWLAWLGLTKLLHHDVLALARARDRLLERLFHQGLTAEHDLPGFMWPSTANTNRQQVVREQLLRLRELAAEWIVEPPSHLARTRAYADLIFAFGLVRLGERDEAQRILAWARRQLDKRDTLHAWALQAFQFRIDEAARGATRLPLSDDLRSIMDLMDRLDRYKADRLRQHSRIIEPFERINPYRRWHRQYTDELARELACLFDLSDRNELMARLRELMSSTSRKSAEPEARVRLLATALELSPRLGERFAIECLAQVESVWQAASDVVDRAWLLEKSLQVAAHFDQRDAVHAFVERFESILPQLVDCYLNLQSEHNPAQQEKRNTIGSLFQQSLNGYRKLGLRDEIERIFVQLVQRLRSAPLNVTPHVGSVTQATSYDPRAAKLLLTVAGGWYYFGQVERGQLIVDEVRQALFTEQIHPIAKAQLAKAYVTAVAQAPPHTALPLIEQLFGINERGERNLHSINDSMTTSSHFSLSQLDLVEATVLSLVSDEFVLSPETRQWLEEDEFFVRRRIHRDVRSMIASGAE